jgi:hypothetical protein
MGDGLSRLFADIPGNPPLQRLMTTATTLSELVELAGMAVTWTPEISPG